MLNGCLVVVSNKKNVRAPANTTWKKKSVSGFFNKKIFSYHYFSPEFPPSPWHFIIWPSYMAVVGGAARIDTEKAARSWPVRQWRWPWAAKRRPPMRQMGGQVLAKAWPPFHRLGRPCHLHGQPVPSLAPGHHSISMEVNRWLFNKHFIFI